MLHTPRRLRVAPRNISALLPSSDGERFRGRAKRRGRRRGRAPLRSPSPDDVVSLRVVLPPLFPLPLAQWPRRGRGGEGSETTTDLLRGTSRNSCGECPYTHVRLDIKSRSPNTLPGIRLRKNKRWKETNERREERRENEQESIYEERKGSYSMCMCVCVCVFWENSPSNECALHVYVYTHANERSGIDSVRTLIRAKLNASS